MQLPATRTPVTAPPAGAVWNTLPFELHTHLAAQELFQRAHEQAVARMQEALAALGFTFGPRASLTRSVAGKTACIALWDVWGADAPLRAACTLRADCSVSTVELVRRASLRRDEGTRLPLWLVEDRVARIEHRHARVGKVPATNPQDFQYDAALLQGLLERDGAYSPENLFSEQDARGLAAALSL